jgi:hypothetical protein
MYINRQRTKLKNPPAHRELEIDVPDLDRWWVVMQLSPPVGLSPEEIARRREEVRHGTSQILQDLDFFQKEERRIMERLEKPGCGQNERKELANYLEAIRTYLRITRTMLEAWGLVPQQAA